MSNMNEQPNYTNSEKLANQLFELSVGVVLEVIAGDIEDLTKELKLEGVTIERQHINRRIFNLAIAHREVSDLL